MATKQGRRWRCRSLRENRVSLSSLEEENRKTVIKLKEKTRKREREREREYESERERERERKEERERKTE